MDGKTTLNLSDLFPFPNYDDWKLEAEKLLKGAPFDKVIKTETVEGITLNGLYSETPSNFYHLPVTKTEQDEKPKIKIDLSIYNDSGSSAVDDLGLMCALIVSEANKSNLNDIFTKTEFIFGVGSNIFMEIAKLRAARYLFLKLAEAYGIEPNGAYMRIHAKTSYYTKTFYDPWVNILRTSTETFSAIVGGCDSIDITPFDSIQGESDDFSKRIARNQELILKEEAHLNAVADPAAGSYYVETLTFELISKGWELFLEIEDKGGFEQASDFIVQKINKSHEYRLKNAETRKDNIVGTSIFANLNEKRVATTPNTIGEDGVIPKRRLSSSFEEIRNTVEKIEPRPEVFVANIGRTVKNKARVDFALGFFEPAGFYCHVNDGFEDVTSALNYVKESKAKIVVLCSTDDQYPVIVPDFAKEFKTICPEKTLVLAGYPKDHLETFTKAGVDFYIYMRANVVTTITNILSRI